MVGIDEFTEYVASERFIHDNIVREAIAGLPAITTTWREKGSVDPFLIAWPSKPLRADDGSIIDRQVYTDLPTDRSGWKKLFADFVERTKPYALLLAEEDEDEVLVVVESKHGTKSWHFTIERHGPDRILKDPVEKTNKASIGILWQRRMPTG